MSSGKSMKGSQREVVLEIEHTTVVRKRAKTKVELCRQCGSIMDFITVARAAELFSITTAEMFEFSQSQAIHFWIDEGENIHLCLTDLLSAMSKRLRTGTVKLLGEKLCRTQFSVIRLFFA
jgi:hypothetical protein